MMVHPIYQLYRNKVKSDHSVIKKFKCVECIKVDFLRTEGFAFSCLLFTNAKKLVNCFSQFSAKES